jgi:hypothetical protein
MSFETNASELPIGPILLEQLTLENGTDTSRNNAEDGRIQFNPDGIIRLTASSL